MNKRIKKVFENEQKKLVTFVTGCDPDFDTSKKIIKTLSSAGSDIIEIGMPFSDPMADGPTIQISSKRAIEKGADLDKIFNICSDFRSYNQETPLILMGYYNVIFHYGVKKFVETCEKNKVDGLIIVDLQPEEDSELINTIKSSDLDLIRLITPTTDPNRLRTILQHSSGFLYYVTITGITGQHSAKIQELEESIKKIKTQTNLPIVAGFGIKNEMHVKEVSKICDGVVVGSAIVKIIEENLNNNDKSIEKIFQFVKKLKEGTKQ